MARDNNQPPPRPWRGQAPPEAWRILGGLDGEAAGSAGAGLVDDRLAAQVPPAPARSVRCYRRQGRRGRLPPIPGICNGLQVHRHASRRCIRALLGGLCQACFESLPCCTHGRIAIAGTLGYHPLKNGVDRAGDSKILKVRSRRHSLRQQNLKLASRPGKASCLSTGRITCSPDCINHCASTSVGVSACSGA